MLAAEKLERFERELAEAIAHNAALAEIAKNAVEESSEFVRKYCGVPDTKRAASETNDSTLSATRPNQQPTVKLLELVFNKWLEDADPDECEELCDSVRRSMLESRYRFSYVHI